jgi:hypothetical protein
MEALQYIAGFFDADGCAVLNYRHGPYVVFSQGEKKKDILEFIQKELGNGVLELAIKATKEGNQNLYNLRYSNMEAVRIMTLLEPYLIEKKNKAKIISNWLCGYTTAKVIKAYDMENNGELIGKYNTIGECARSLSTSTFKMHQPTITKCLQHDRIFGARDCDFKIHGKRIRFEEIEEESGIIIENHERLYDEWLDCEKPSTDMTTLTFPYYAKNVLDSTTDDISIQYISGFAEGDGCFCIQKNGNGFRIICTIGQKNLNILIYIMKYFKFGTIYRYVKNEESFYEWCIINNDAVLYMNSILEYTRSFCVRSQMKEIIEYGATLDVKNSIKRYKANDTTSNKRIKL